MWSNIILGGRDSSEHLHPPSRYKHACVLVPVNTNTTSNDANSASTNSNNYDLYLYGGRSGTFPLKDFWRLDLRLGKWEELKAPQSGGGSDWPPHLQEHTMVYFERRIYVFGGEISFSYGEDSAPLWIYSLDVRTIK
jgi:hypothetical protein